MERGYRFLRLNNKKELRDRSAEGVHIIEVDGIPTALIARAGEAALEAEDTELVEISIDGSEQD